MGEILPQIADKYGVPAELLAKINGIADPSKIQTGQRVFIPGARKVLKVEIVIDDVAAEQVERERDRPKTVYEKMDLIWPVEGKLGDGFEDDERKRTEEESRN